MRRAGPCRLCLLLPGDEDGGVSRSLGMLLGKGGWGVPWEGRWSVGRRGLYGTLG